MQILSIKLPLGPVKIDDKFKFSKRDVILDIDMMNKSISFMKIHTSQAFVPN